MILTLANAISLMSVSSRSGPWSLIGSQLSGNIFPASNPFDWLS